MSETRRELIDAVMDWLWQIYEHPDIALTKTSRYMPTYEDACDILDGRAALPRRRQTQSTCLEGTR